MLGGPAALGSRTVIVGPDDLVHERVPAEYFVEHDLAVMDLPVIDVQKEASIGLEDPARLLHALPQEADVVVEAIVEPGRTHPDGSIALALETHPVAVPVGDGAEADAGLAPARVERRIDVDEGKGFPRRALQIVEIFLEDDLSHEGVSEERPDRCMGATPGDPGRRPAADEPIPDPDQPPGAPPGVDVERVEGLARGHEQPIALGAPEADVGAALRQGDAADRRTVRREHPHAVQGFAPHAPPAPEIPVHVAAHPVRRAARPGVDQHLPVDDPAAVAGHVVGADPPVRLGPRLDHVEPPLVRREAEPVRPRQIVGPAP